MGGRKGIRPVKTEWWGAGTVICLKRGADLHMAQLMPLPLTASCSSKIQIGFTFLVPAHPGSPDKGPLNGCVLDWMGGGQKAATERPLFSYAYPCVAASRASSVFPVRDALVQLRPQRLRFPRRGKAVPELAQDRSAVRTQVQDVGEAAERVHDGLERGGGAELVEKLHRGGVGAGGRGTASGGRDAGLLRSAL